MTKKTDENLTPTFDESADTKIYEKDVDTGILNAAQQAIENKLWEDFQVSQAADTTELPTISWGNIGDYRIIRKIGEGGMGIVYEAEQQHPRRLVALKVIRTGFHADEYHIKLFEREIQALARLKHPGIADIYESGRSDNEQIFFAMELVRGTPLLEFVRRQKFSDDNPPFDVVQQLELFRKICEVVAYAHQRGVIHRDLKPDNILVTDESEQQSSNSGSITSKLGVKILDFGLARITDPDVVGTDQLSKAGQIKGTLQYMSPEQVRGKPEEIDVRSDVYSLGVILYEMLTDCLPYDVSQASIPEAVRIIIEEQPKMPGEICNETRSEGRKKSGKIDKDVETIVLKALEKDPERRYQSVAGMSDDIERYLTNKPILARPPSRYYQFRKLVARHKTAFASLAIIFLMLLGFGVVMAAQSARLARERDNAARERDRALKAEQIAEEQKNEAERSRESERKQRIIAEENLRRAEEQQSIAEKAQKSEQEQRLIAENNLHRAQEEQKRAEEQTALAEKQQAIAHEQKTLAEKRQVETEEQRLKTEEQKTLAEQREEANRRMLYVSQMNLAEQAWEQADIPRLKQLLENQIPKLGQEDLRGFEWYYLWNLANQDLWTFQKRVDFAGFSSDGKILAVNGFEASEGNLQIPVISILKKSTGQEVDIIKGRISLGFLPDGKLLTLSIKEIDFEKLRDNYKEEYPVELLDLKTKQISPTKLKITYSPGPYGFLLSPDGKLMWQRVDKGIELLEVDTGNKIFSFIGEEFWNPEPRFSSDSKMFAIKSSKPGDRESRVTFWDVPTKRELTVLKSDESTFRRMALSPDGKVLATKDYGETIKFWDVATTKQIGRNIEGQETERIFGRGNEGLEFSPDGEILASISGRVVKLLGGIRCGDDPIIKGHGDIVRSVKFSPDSKKLATFSTDGSMKLWNIPDCNLRGQHHPAFSPDGKVLATVDLNKNHLKIWDFATNQELASFGEEQTEVRTSLSSPKFSPDGKVLAVNRHFYSQTAPKRFEEIKTIFELWDVAAKNKLATIEDVRDFAFSPDGKLLATIVRNKSKRVDDWEVHLWDVAEQKMISSLGKGSSIAFSPDGKILAIRASDGKVKLVDFLTGHELGSFFKSETFSKDAIKFSPDGKIIATIVNNTIVLWDFANWKEIATLKGHADRISSMAFSPDSKRLVTVSSEDKTVRVWDVGTLQELIAFKNEQVHSVTFSADGKALVVGEGFGIQIWKAATEEEVLKRRNQ